jgi:hypothetical protein
LAHAARNPQEPKIAANHALQVPLHEAGTLPARQFPVYRPMSSDWGRQKQSRHLNDPSRTYTYPNRGPSPGGGQGADKDPLLRLVNLEQGHRLTADARGNSLDAF